MMGEGKYRINKKELGEDWDNRSTPKRLPILIIVCILDMAPI